MDINKLFKGYAQTKGHITSAVMGAAGWDMHRYDAVAASGPQVFLYVFDKPTGFIWMASVSREEFSKASTQASKDNDLVQPSRDSLVHVLFHAASCKPPAPIDGCDWEHQLGMLLAIYAGTTRTWEQADRFRAGGHFIVLNYRNSGTDENSKLRPFAVANTNNTALSAEDLQGYIKQVMGMDMGRHPEWFK